MSVRKLVIAAGVLVVFAWLWSRLRGDAEVDAAPPGGGAALDDAVSSAVGTPPPDPSASA